MKTSMFSKENSTESLRCQLSSEKNVLNPDPIAYTLDLKTHDFTLLTPLSHFKQ